MSAREALVSRARAWIGTPYCHRASVRGAGCDCLGLIRGLWRETHGAEPESVPAYTPDWAESARDEVLWAAMARHMRVLPRGAPWEAGQVLLFRLRTGTVARHLGLLSQSSEPGAGRFVHAYERHGVVESPLSPPWARRVAARFEFI